MAKTAADLNDKQKLFVREYLISLNAVQAALKAGYSKATARAQAARLLANVGVQEAVRAEQSRVSEKLEISHEQLVARLWKIATANPNDLVAHRVGACRYCHGGIEHDYQWRTAREYIEASAKQRADYPDAEPLSDRGGYGYRRSAQPHPDCPECDGEGAGYLSASDTAALRGAARLLYDGVKQTRDGIEIKLQDRAKALEQVARHLGFFNDKVTLKGDTENPLTILIAQLGKSALPVVAVPPSEEGDE